MNILILLSLWLGVVIAAEPPNTSPYGTICLGILGNIYKFNGKNCSTTSFKNAKCYCTDDRFTRSVVSCIDQYMSNVTVQKREASRNSSYKTVTGTCKKTTVDSLTKMQSNISSLPIYSGKGSGMVPGKWPVDSAFTLTQQELWDGLQAYYLSGTDDHKNEKYGAALLGFWGVIALIKGTLHWGAKLFPQAPHVLGNTTAGRIYRQYFQISCSKYSLVTTLQMLIILGFAVLLLCLSFLDLPYHYPSYLYRYNNVSTYGNYLATRTGVLALYILPLLILFAGRNNFLLWLTGWTQEPFLVFHRWVARGEVFLVLVHTVAYSINRVGVNRYGYMWTLPYWRWGVVSLTFAMVILVQAVRFIRHAAYETFLIIHIISAILFIVGGYYHLKLLKHLSQLNYFYASFAVWGFDRLMRIGRIILGGVHQTTVTLEGDNMLVMTIQKPKWWPASRNPGSYVFVHFLTPYSFWQSHPLTLTASTADPTKIKLYFRVYNGISKTLAAHAIAAGDGGKKISVLLDGPYGTSHDLIEFNECVFVAGGSGITSPLAYIQNAHKKSPNRKFQRTTLHWAISDRAPLGWFSEELRFLQKDAEVIVNIYISDQCGSEITSNASSVGEKYSDEQEKTITARENQVPSTYSEQDINVHGRLNVENVIGNTVVNSEGSVSVMCCGPAGLHAATRNAIANNMSKTKNYVQYYEEAYTW